MQPVNRQPVPENALEIWRAAYQLIGERAEMEIVFPGWWEEVCEGVFVDDIATRRYYPTFVEACRAVCLIRSFQEDHSQPKDGKIYLDFIDFAVAALIFEEVFVESLHHHEGSSLEVRRAVETISGRREGEPIQAKDLAEELNISMDAAYQRLRVAAKAGAVRQVKLREKNNRKLFLPTPRIRFIPDPQDLFLKVNKIGSDISFIHPITGEEIQYRKPMKTGEISNKPGKTDRQGSKRKNNKSKERSLKNELDDRYIRRRSRELKDVEEADDVDQEIEQEKDPGEEDFLDSGE